MLFSLFMSITTNLVQAIASIQTVIFVFLLLPLRKSIKYTFLTLLRSKSIRPLSKVILAIYTMILLFFLDSVYRINSLEDILLKYYHKANSYLTGFTIFNALILYRFIQMSSHNMIEEEKTLILKKQCINQKDFVNKIMKELQEKKEEIKEINDKLKKEEILKKQYKNNETAYFNLLDKYNELKEQMETKKKR